MRNAKWSDIPRNPFVTALDVRMLGKEGLSIKKTIRLKGDVAAYPTNVNYDSGFVINYIRKHLTDKMPSLTDEDWLILISRAMLPVDKDDVTPFEQKLSINENEH